MDGAKPVQLGRQGSAIAPVVRQSSKEPPEQALRHLAEGVLAQRIPRLEAFQPRCSSQRGGGQRLRPMRAPSP